MASIDEKSPAEGVSIVRNKEEKSTRGRTMAAVEDDDERLLNQIGYTQVILPQISVDSLASLTNSQDLRRHFTRWSTLSYAVSVLGVLGSVPATFGSPLSLGGPAASVWAWFFGSLMASCISASGI